MGRGDLIRLACLALVAAVSAGCTNSEEPETVEPGYVAIGDSFTATPGVAPVADTSACGRSGANYPSLVARALDLALTDVSCSGATSADVLTGKAPLAPQIDAVTKKTDLVTVSVGANDAALYLQLGAHCLVRDPQHPPAPCHTTLDASIEPFLAQIDGNLRDVLDAVRARAPKAVVAVVGYLRISPGTTCDELPITAEDAAWLRSVEDEINASFADAAREADALWVDLHETSSGHEVCTDDPWVNGWNVSEGDGVVMHPNAEGAKAAAAAVEAAVPSLS